MTKIQKYLPENSMKNQKKSLIVKNLFASDFQTTKECKQNKNIKNIFISIQKISLREEKTFYSFVKTVFVLGIHCFISQ